MYWLIGIVFVLILLFMLAPIRIAIDMEKKNKRYDMSIVVTVWYVFRKKIEVPQVGLEEQTSSLIIHKKTETTLQQSNEKDIKETPKEMKAHIQTMRMWIRHIHSFRPIVKNFFQKITVTKWQWNSSIGTGDAALTGVITGGLWSVKYFAHAVLSSFMTVVTPPDFSIQPYFQKKIFDFHLSCMVSFRLGHAVIAGYQLWRQMRGNVWELWKQTKWNNKVSKEASS